MESKPNRIAHESTAPVAIAHVHHMIGRDAVVRVVVQGTTGIFFKLLNELFLVRHQVDADIDACLL